MCAVQDSFKHWTAARWRIDYPIRECPVWRKATGGSGSLTDLSRTGQLRMVGADVRFSRERTLERLQLGTTIVQMSRHLGIKLDDTP
jgi:hypothetical protein